MTLLRKAVFQSSSESFCGAPKIGVYGRLTRMSTLPNASSICANASSTAGFVRGVGLDRERPPARRFDACGRGCERLRIHVEEHDVGSAGRQGRRRSQYRGRRPRPDDHGDPDVRSNIAALSIVISHSDRWLSLTAWNRSRKRAEAWLLALVDHGRTATLPTLGSRPAR